MEINPYESRLRMLQQFDGVQMQREATPDEETAGCPGCPYFWTCPVPHRGEEVKAPAQIELEDVRDSLGPRTEYRPRDESDVGWTDTWVDENGHRIEDEALASIELAEDHVETTDLEDDPAELADVALGEDGADDDAGADAADTARHEPALRRFRWNPFRRRR
ncbi:MULTISPECIES: hypothetical protein [unclassified Brachybacterium]|uniref:hypothetical protein n=1 Tax=unclassified Brachybacterium TaxID=2623841 RepID=UPI00360B7A4C